MMGESCVVCGQPGTMNRKALNGLPKDIIICETCKTAVGNREVGIVRRPDGSLHITDGRI